MAYKSYSRFSSRKSTGKLARKSKRNFIITIIITSVLVYSSFAWILPSFIGGISVIKETVNPSQKVITSKDQNSSLAPPVLNIPYEATNSSQINISGYGTSGSKVNLYLDDELKNTTEVKDDGSFVFENVELSLGTNNIYGKTLDDTDKESLPSKNIKLYYIHEKPSLTISEPEDGRKIQGGDKKVKVSGKTDPQVKVFINDTQIIVDNNGNFSVDQPLNEGENTLIIRAVDIASNTNIQERKITFSP